MFLEFSRVKVNSLHEFKFPSGPTTLTKAIYDKEKGNHQANFF